MSAAVAHSFNKLLNQPKSATKSRATGDTDDAAKKLRRMILVEGLPSTMVRVQIFSRRRDNNSDIGFYPTTSNMEDLAQGK